jgi:hypothetical protein
MPTTFVIRGGYVRHVHPGFSGGDEATIAKIVDRELKKLR